MLGYGQARAGGESPHIGRRRALQLATAAALVAPRGVRAEEEAAEAVVEELGNKPIFLEGVEELAPPPLEAQVCGALIAAVKPWPAHSGLEDTAGVTTLPAGCAEAPAQPCFGMPQRSSTLSLSLLPREPPSPTQVDSRLATNLTEEERIILEYNQRIALFNRAPKDFPSFVRIGARCGTPPRSRSVRDCSLHAAPRPSHCCSRRGRRR